MNPTLKVSVTLWLMWATILVASPAPIRLIVAADDAGQSSSTNRGTMTVLAKGIVSSASVLVTCPGFEEFVSFARKHPKHDYGIHLSLNSEMEEIACAPVSPLQKVPSLVNSKGQLWKTQSQVVRSAKADEVERELRAQIQKAKASGVAFSHMDSHMGTIFTRADITEIYIRLSIELGIPALFPSEAMVPQFEKEFPALKGKTLAFSRRLSKRGFPTFDFIHQERSLKSFEESAQNYERILQGLKPGLNYLIVHCATPVDLDSLENYSKRMRFHDRAIFTDNRTAGLIQSYGIQLMRGFFSQGIREGFDSLRPKVILLNQP